MQGGTATTRHEVLRKRSKKRIKHKEPRVNRCLLILDLKPFRS